MDSKRHVGAALRFLASGGFADQDADVIAELLNDAKELAALVVADANSSSQARELAKDFLERLETDTLP